MAVPPLSHQIKHASAIVLCTTKIAGGTISYRVDEVWKATSPKAGESLRLNIGTHQLLGYRPVDEQKVVVFFSPGLPADSPLEVLPLVDDVLTYSPHDQSVQEKLTPQALKERVAGLTIPLKVSFVGLKSVPVISLGHNNAAPLLVLFEDHLVQRVIFRTERKYAEIESVEVSKTDTDNLEIAYTDSRLTFSCKLREAGDLVRALRVFARKGVPLGERAKKLLGAS